MAGLGRGHIDGVHPRIGSQILVAAAGGAVNPVLSIMANAWRVADLLSR